MFRDLSKFLLFLMLAVPANVACAQSPPAESPKDAPAVAPADPKPAPAPEMQKPAPFPYELTHEYHYTWVIEGEEIGKTTLTAETVTEQNGSESLLVRGRFDFDRAGRKLSGTSRLFFAENHPASPVRFTGRLSIDAREHGSHEEKFSLRVIDGIASITVDDGSAQLRRSKLPCEEPLFVLEAQCFEHWAVISPRFGELVGKLRVLVPSERSYREYELTRVGEEKGAQGVRTRWKIEHPAQEALLWTDAKGRLVEYHQEPLQIVLTEVAAPKKATGTTAAPGENSGKKQ